MIITYQSELDVRFLTNPNKGRRWMLLKPFVFYVGSQRFVVPAGFYTDFASVPRVVWSIMSPYDLGKGPIPHDFGYYSGIETKEFWDKVLIDCMKLEEVKKWKHKPVYWAVSSPLGQSVYDEYRKQGSTEEQLNRLKLRV